MKTNDKLMEFRETTNVLDKTRVESGAKKHTHGGGSGNSGTGFGSETSHVQASLGEEMCDQDFCEGSPLNLGDEEDVPNQVTHGTTQTASTCRICKWIDGPGRTRLDRGKPFADPNNLFVNYHSKYFHGCPKFVDDGLEKKQSLL